MNQNQRNSAIIFRKNPSPAGAPLLPDLLRYQTPAVLHTYTAARLMPCTCLRQAGLRQKQRLQNLGGTKKRTRLYQMLLR